MSSSTKLKVLVFIVAYNAEKSIASVIERIPRQLSQNYDLSLLIIDDSSKDNTQAVAQNCLEKGFWCPFMVLRNPENQGYGGNQKVGYHYAIENGFDVVVLLHGDGQYAPEYLPTLIEPFAEQGKPDAVFGSRMLNRRDALKGGMPFYKFAGNQILTAMQNRLLGSQLSEFHTGYRAYSVTALQKIPFDLNTDDFHFDTEIIVQLFFSGARVVELPIPTFYGEEVCHVNGLRYAWDVTKASVKARLIRMGIFFDPKFALQNKATNYVSKFEFQSTHSVAFVQVPERSMVLDLGCADGYLSERLHREKDCVVFSVDVPQEQTVAGCSYQSCDLNTSLPNVPWDRLDMVILLDVIEHLNNPEMFLEHLRAKLSGNDKVKIIVSSGNVCFFITRFMMFLGQFNYGRRGILDITHTRLFTVSSLERLLRYAAYRVEDRRYIPAPFPLAIGLNAFSRFMVGVNGVLARLMPGLFAYQSLYVIRPRPSIDWLLQQAVESAPGLRK